MTKQSDFVPLNCRTMTFSTEGLDNYFWPITLEKDRLFFEDILRRYVSVVKHGLENDVRGATELMVLSNVLVEEIRSLISAKIIVESCKAFDKKIDFQENCMRFIPAALENRPPHQSQILKKLHEAFPQNSLAHYLLKPLRKIKKRLGQDKKSSPIQAPTQPSGPPKKRAIGSRKIRSHHLKHNIVSTKRKGIVSEHARRISDRVVLAAYKFWFKPVSKNDVRKHAFKADSSLTSQLIQTVKDTFQQKGFSLERHNEEYLSDLISQCVPLVHIHLERLRKNPKRLPTTLWTGTCGNIWDRMLRIVVMENGGKVTGHSHAGGGECYNYAYRYSSEFIACDEFCVHNPTQVNKIKEHVDPSLLFQGIPQIISPPGQLTLDYVELPQAELHEPKNLMVMSSSAYGSDRTYDAAYLNFSTEIDFLARLFSDLVADSYKIYFKPHPEAGAAPPPDSLEETTGAVRLTENYEKVMHLADVVIFLDPRSSTFHASIMGDKPVVLFNTGFIPWDDDALELLKTRCAVVPVSRTDSNQLSVDIELVKQAIQSAPKLVKNRDFAMTYYSVGTSGTTSNHSD